jgi:tRNA dimethylallyltransferase
VAGELPGPGELPGDPGANDRPAPLEVVALFGPTGAGKTDVAIALADLLRVRKERPVAISADALQVYAGLETLTGAADERDRARLEHRLVGIRDVRETFSVGEFAPLAHAEIDRALAEGRRPIVVGGTGLYLRAALTEMDLKPPPPRGLRERIEARVAERGVEALHGELSERAPTVAATIEPTDRSRVVRALELAEIGELDDPPGDSQLWTADTRRPTLLFGLTMERERLYRRIDERVDAMVAAGAVDEVRRAAASGASITARKALGFEELMSGEVETMKRRTRNYAKRQLTWMRKLAGVRTIDVTGRRPLDVASEIARVLAA